MGEPACIHGEVCREYMRQFGCVRNIWRDRNGLQPCIISTSCPDGCRFYEPKRDRRDPPSQVMIAVEGRDMEKAEESMEYDQLLKAYRSIIEEAARYRYLLQKSEEKLYETQKNVESALDTLGSVRQSVRQANLDYMVVSEYVSELEGIIIRNKILNQEALDGIFEAIKDDMTEGD